MKRKKLTETAVLVKFCRESRDLTQMEMASKLGYKTAQFISNVERGICALPVNSFKAVSKVLDVHLLSLFNAHIKDYADEVRKKLKI